MAYKVLNGYRDIEILMDGVDDLKDLPTNCPVGSIAYTADQSLKATLSPSKVWVQHKTKVSGGAAEKEMVEKVLFKLEDYEFNIGSGGVCTTQVSDTLNVEIGTACIVEFDGKKYECVATECNMSGLPPAALGNLSLFNSNNQFGGNFADTGEPFLIVYAPGEPVVMIVAKSDEAIHTFKISVLEEKSSGSGGGSNSECLGSGVETLTFIFEDDTAVDIKVVIAE